MLYQTNRNLFYLIIIFIIIQTRIISSFKCEQDGFFPDKRDCWIYHICVGTTHSIKACQEDLLFNPIKKECDWAINVNCTPSIYVDPRPTEILRSTDLINNSTFDYLCQTIDNDYIGHPTDCKRYAYCANGVPQAKLCKKTLLWSQAEKMCVWPAQSDCPMKNPTTVLPIVRDSSRISQGTTYPSSYILTDAPPPLSSLNVYKSSVICPPTKSWRVPDPYDCSIYHDCYYGTDLISYCPAQFQYNREKQNCDHAQNVQCKNKCTIKNEGARFIDPTSCCHFYECLSGRLILQTCSQPNLFDIQTRKCLSYKNVKCDDRRQCLTKCHYSSNRDAGKNLCDYSSSCTSRTDGFYLDRTKPNCQSYIQCLDNRLVNHSRCSYGQRFNRNMGRCTPADQVPCLASSLSNRISLILFILLIVVYIVQN